MHHGEGVWSVGPPCTVESKVESRVSRVGEQGEDDTGRLLAAENPPDGGEDGTQGKKERWNIGVLESECLCNHGVYHRQDSICYFGRV